MARASIIDHCSQPSMQDRVEIDTSLPFQSVKAALSMFGEKADAKMPRLVEKRGTKEAEVHKLKDELAILKLQLVEAQKGKAKAYEELEDAKKLLGEGSRDSELSTQSPQGSLFADGVKQNHLILTDGLEQDKRSDTLVDGSEQSERNLIGLKQSNPNAEEKHVVWEGKLKFAQEQHMSAVVEMELAKKEVRTLKEELEASLREKERALRQAEEALTAAELNARRVEELSHEISGTNESLVLVKLACIEASKERATLLAAKSGESSPHPSIGAQYELSAVQELEIQLGVAVKELVRLRKELALAKAAEVKVATAASGAYASLAQAKSELEQTRLQACSSSGSSGTLSSELKMTKRELAKALENGILLQAAMDALQGELEAMRKELADLTSREENASAAVVTLTTELTKTKADLASAMAAENKTNEAMLGLTETLQQTKFEVDEAKLNANILREEASKARVDAEHAKEAMTRAEQEVDIAIKAAEAAKAAKNVAIKQFKGFAEERNVTGASGVEGGEGVILFQEDFEQLKKKVHEAEELASMRVIDANTQVEAMKIRELELERTLKILNDDVDNMQHSTQQALQRAEMAESAKLAVEGELRKWREKQRLAKKVEFVDHVREREVDTLAQTDQLKMGGRKSQALRLASSAYVRQPTESLAQILNMKMPSLEHDVRLFSDRALAHKKKKHYLLSLRSFSTKKSLVEIRR